MGEKDDIMAEINTLLDEQLATYKRGMTPEEAFSYTQCTARIRELFGRLLREHHKESP
jgi:hypothetical protein